MRTLTSLRTAAVALTLTAIGVMPAAARDTAQLAPKAQSAPRRETLGRVTGLAYRRQVTNAELIRSIQGGSDCTVTFRTNGTTVAHDAIAALSKLGALAALLPDVMIHVDGYADPRGPEILDDDISQRRAEAVAAVLESAGASPDQLIVVGHGKVTGNGRKGDRDVYALDRRVTVRFEDGTEEIARRD